MYFFITIQYTDGFKAMFLFKGAQADALAYIASDKAFRPIQRIKFRSIECVNA